MKNIVIGMLILLLISYGITKTNEFLSPVESISVKGVDGYAFHSKEYTNETVLVTIKIFKNRKEFNDAAQKLGIKIDYGKEYLMAFSLTEKDPRFCTIYMVDQEVEYAPQYVGHEFLHCVHGQWHISNDSKGLPE